MVTIWGRSNSSNVKKVLWCADELSVPFEQIQAGGQFGRNNEADYLAMNPNGLVPCLQDGDLVLWESNAIVRYLVARYGKDSPLFLSDPAAQAGAEKWMDWTFTLAAPFSGVFINLVRTAPEQRDAQAVARGMAECERLLTLVDSALARQPWLTGSEFGIGDIPLGCVAYGWFNMAIERAPHPHLERWYRQLTQRPAYRARVMLPLT